MGGYGKFFFGGLVGALFGFLVSPKRGQKVREALLGSRPAEVEQSSARLLEAPSLEPVSRPVPPEPFDWREEAPAVVEAELETEAEPVVEPRIEPDGAFEPEAEAETESEVRVAEGAEETEVEPSGVAEESGGAEAAEADTEELVEQAENVSAQADQLEAPPYEAEAPTHEPEVPPHEPAEPAYQEAEEPEQAPEVYAEEPFVVDLPVWTVPVDDDEIETLSAAGPETASEEGVADDTTEPAEQTVEETAPEAVAEAAPAAAWPESLWVPEGERPVEPEPTPPPEPPEPEEEPSLEPAEPSSVTPSGVAPADLKARIEETRRRIQKELEQPFVESEAAEQRAVSFDPPRPEDFVAEPAAVPEDESPTAQEGEPAEAEDEAARTTTEATAEEAPAPEPSAPALNPTTGEFDQEAMRRRIEETRSRLKAKAFDAMMSGESALLGRDEGKGGSAQGARVSVDTEVDKTIESTLTEEDF